MARGHRSGGGRLIALAILAATGLGASSGADVVAVVGGTKQSHHATRAPLDADAFFERLVRRYRQLSHYEDTTDLVQVTEHAGRAPERIETRLACEIEAGDLRVQSPSRQLRQGLGVDLPVRTGEAMRDLRRRYAMWLAPHLALRFADTPLEELREGVAEAFQATEAESVTIDDKRMVQLHLESPGFSEDVTASFDFFVNAESMLIERIEGEQRLPDGGSQQTTLVITPTLAVDENGGGAESVEADG
jgi:hypothetical protein